MSVSLQDLGNILNGGMFNSNIVASPQSALQNEFMMTPGYQLAYGQNFNLDPAQRFLSDPGTQLAVYNSTIPLLRSVAGRGLSQSGALADAMQRKSFSDYNNFNQAQSGMFRDYQSQLAGLDQFGAQYSGADQAFQTGSMLGQLLGGYNMQTGQNLSNAALATGQNLGNANLATGQNMSNANLSTGENISSLLANQGMFGGNSYLNTGAAQANNLFNGMSLLAQLNANQNAGYAQTQNSMLQGQGAMNGANYLKGGLF